MDGSFCGFPLAWGFIFPESFMDPCCPIHHPVDGQVGTEAKREVVSLLHWHPGKSGELMMWKIWEASLFSRFPKGWTAKTRGKYYLRTQTQCLSIYHPDVILQPKKITRKLPTGFVQSPEHSVIWTLAEAVELELFGPGSWSTYTYLPLKMGSLHSTGKVYIRQWWHFLLMQKNKQIPGKGIGPVI